MRSLLAAAPAETMDSYHPELSRFWSDEAPADVPQALPQGREPQATSDAAADAAALEELAERISAARSVV